MGPDGIAEAKAERQAVKVPVLQGHDREDHVGGAGKPATQDKIRIRTKTDAGYLCREAFFVKRHLQMDIGELELFPEDRVKALEYGFLRAEVKFRKQPRKSASL